MAQLKNKSIFSFKKDAPQGPVTVGHNRIAMREGNTIKCTLHGHNVVTFERMKELGGGYVLMITANHCGYITATTRNAITDFMRAMGVRGGASITEGELTIYSFDTWDIELTTKANSQGEAQHRIRFEDLKRPLH